MKTRFSSLCFFTCNLYRYTLGQPHEEKDKNGAACVAYDFCVSTHTYELTQSDERLKGMVVETAIEAGLYKCVCGTAKTYCTLNPKS
jgi:hypothetical protein